MQYFIEQRISSLADNYVGAGNSPDPHFELDGITYRQWEFNYGDGALGDAWVAEGTIEAKSGGEAIMLFHNKLVKAVPIISLISQCYIEFRRQPLLLKRSDTDVAFIDYVHDSEHVGLMFMDDDYAGLQKLFANTTIRPEFYKYWNDAQNTIGYSPKLLLMFSALEALVKKPNGDKDWGLLESILGTGLKDKIFTPRTGLRHRLTHGEYFSPTDGGSNYVDQVHRKVIAYFNGLIGSDVISEDTVHPQRHFYDNKMVGKFFLRSKDASAPLRLREVIADFEANDHHATKYDYVFDENITKNY
jgi:hypothetical protein